MSGVVPAPKVDWSNLSYWYANDLLRHSNDVDLLLEALDSPDVPSAASTLSNRRNLPEVVMRRIAQDPDPRVRNNLVLTQFEHLPRDVQDDLAKDPSAMVQAMVARKTSVREHQLMLAGSTSEQALFCLAGNLDLYAEVGSILSFCTVSPVRRALAENRWFVPSSEFSASCLAEYFPRSVLEGLLPGVDREMMWALAPEWNKSVRSLSEAILLAQR